MKGKSEFNGAFREGHPTWGCRIRVVRRVLLVLLLYFSLALFVYLRLMPRWAERFEKDRQSASDRWLTARDNVVRYFVLPVELARLHCETAYKWTDAYLQRNWQRRYVYARKPPVCRWRKNNYSEAGALLSESVYATPKVRRFGCSSSWDIDSGLFAVGDCRDWDESGQLILETSYNEFGQEDGIHSEWLSDGRLFCRHSFRNGLRHGESLKKWGPDMVRGEWVGGCMQNGTFFVMYQPQGTEKMWISWGIIVVSNNVVQGLFRDSDLKSPVESGVLEGWFIWDEESRSSAEWENDMQILCVVISNAVPTSLRALYEDDEFKPRFPPGDPSQYPFFMRYNWQIRGANRNFVRIGFRKDPGNSEGATTEWVDKSKEPSTD